VLITANYSTLRLPHVTAPLDSGNYTCEPHNLRPDMVAVHILGGQNSINGNEGAEETAAAAVHDDNEVLDMVLNSRAALPVSGSFPVKILLAICNLLLQIR
jgi:hypothetical protein